MKARLGRGGLVAHGLLLLFVAAAIGQEKEQTVPTRTPLSWDSPRMRDIEREWRLLKRAPRDAVPDRDPKSMWQMDMARRLIAKRLSTQDASDLATSCTALPVDTKAWGLFNREVFERLFWYLDRAALVGLLSRRCPDGVWGFSVEFVLAVRGNGTNLRTAPDLVLVLGEAYARSEIPRVRQELAWPVRRAFAGFGIQGKDDAEFVKNAMQWYEKNKGHLTLHRAYSGMHFTGDPPKYQEEPGYYDRDVASGQANPLFAERPATEGAPGASQEPRGPTSQAAPEAPRRSDNRTPAQILADLQGSWTVVELTDCGLRLPQEEIKESRFTFRGEKLIKYYGEHLDSREYRIRLGSQQEPHAMDLIRTIYELKPREGSERSELDRLIEEFNEEVTRALYELEGDSLRICVPWEPTMQRPNSFKAGPGSGHRCYLLRRPSLGLKAAVILGVLVVAIGVFFFGSFRKGVVALLRRSNSSRKTGEPCASVCSS